jgi:hypothetical protein
MFRTYDVTKKTLKNFYKILGTKRRLGRFNIHGFGTDRAHGCLLPSAIRIRHTYGHPVWQPPTTQCQRAPAVQILTRMHPLSFVTVVSYSM